LAFRKILRVVDRRHRGQGLVEYAAIAASLAFIGVVGFNSLADAEKGYLQNFPKNGVVPSVPGELLHFTQMDAVSCAPTTVQLNSPITCNNPTVYDIHFPAADRNPPLGMLNFYLDGTVLIPSMSCSLVPKTASTSGCPSATITYTPTNPALATGAARTFVVSYEQQTSNHLGASVTSSAFSIVNWAFIPAPVCVNEGGTFPMPNWVEVGHPITCTATLVNSVTSTGVPNIDLTWSIASGGSGNGVPYLTCWTGGNSALFGGLTGMLYGSSVPAQNPCAMSSGPSATLRCLTDSNGQCKIVYRRIRQQPFATPSGTELQAGPEFLAVTPTFLPIPSPSPAAIAVQDTKSGRPHPAWTWVTCSAGSNTSVKAPVSFPLNVASFQSTPEIQVIGPMGTVGTVSCAPIVVDSELDNAALSCTSTPATCYAPSLDPDRFGANAPVGTIGWEMSATGSANALSACTLSRRDTLVPQAPQQAPFASDCPSVNVQLTNSVAPGGPTLTLVAEYTSTLGVPDHSDSHAAPVVAGAAMLLHQANPKLSESQILSILKSTGSKNWDGDTEYPATYLTYRRLDLDNAIRAALSRRTKTRDAKRTRPAAEPVVHSPQPKNELIGLFNAGNRVSFD